VTRDTTAAAADNNRNQVLPGTAWLDVKLNGFLGPFKWSVALHRSVGQRMGTTSLAFWTVWTVVGTGSENSSLLGCDTALLREQNLTFHRTMVLMKCWDPLPMTSITFWDTWIVINRDVTPSNLIHWICFCPPVKSWEAGYSCTIWQKQIHWADASKPHVVRSVQDFRPPLWYSWGLHSSDMLCSTEFWDSLLLPTS